MSRLIFTNAKENMITIGDENMMLKTNIDALKKAIKMIREEKENVRFDLRTAKQTIITINSENKMLKK